MAEQPHLLLRLAESSLAVAESLRGSYLANTARFVDDLRRTVRQAASGRRQSPPILRLHRVAHTDWAPLRGELATFVDGGLGYARVGTRTPILLRVGTYTVRTGEQRLERREGFGYYPVMLGDLEGGSGDREGFVDLLRLTAELLGGLTILERTPDLRVLMFHGPLVPTTRHYVGYSPLTEHDVDLLLTSYAPDPTLARDIKEEFLSQATRHLYPQMTSQAEVWARRRLFEPLAWLAYLYRRLIRTARRRHPTPIVAGIVERGSGMHEFTEHVILARIFQELRRRHNEDYFNRTFHRTDLVSPRAVLDVLGYTDAGLLALLLQPGEYTDPWAMRKHWTGMRQEEVTTPGDPTAHPVSYDPLVSPSGGFPAVHGCYVCASCTTEPIRVEVFPDLGEHQVAEAAGRAYLYAGLLPRYGFPVGLDVADKHAHVPGWLTDAYGKLIRHHLGASLQRGEIDDAELRQLVIQTIYFRHRDWLFRPQVTPDGSASLP
ncbi:MAG TPA: hypothetical protein VHS99_27080 [Chloroflexota bacterium]|nr:hypothetical protein [Chloroflexota bacterium]